MPLTEYLTEGGSYEGFDIVEEDIDWCRRRITSGHPNFNFRFADVYNKAYNPTGREQASGFRFPYAEGSFDFVFLVSVFTHMLPQDMEHYLSEIARVLRAGGTCLASFFLLSAEARRSIESGRSAMDFPHDFGPWRAMDPAVPEAAIAYDEAFLRGLYGRYGLRIEEPVHHGAWCGSEEALAYQDVIVAAKIGGALA